MTCDYCALSGQKSTIRFTSEVVTSHSVDYFYDEEGKLHNHDLNVTETTFKCSNGHTWKDKSTDRCETCGQ